MKLILAWLFVISALGWGVYRSAVKSAPLFKQTADSSTR
jgi:hypothetical protein